MHRGQAVIVRKWTSGKSLIDAEERFRKGWLIRGWLIRWKLLTAYLLQRIQLLTHRDRYGLAPWSTTGNRSAKPTFQFSFVSSRRNWHFRKRRVRSPRMLRWATLSRRDLVLRALYHSEHLRAAQASMMRPLSPRPQRRHDTVVQRRLLP